eukprot:5210603-Pyramimonas_sp.AAC.1
MAAGGGLRPLPMVANGPTRPAVLCRRQSSVTRNRQQLRWTVGGPDGPNANYPGYQGVSLVLNRPMAVW